MNTINKTALLSLQWILGLTVLIEAALFAFAPASIRAFAKTGLPDWVRTVEAWSEMFAAILFLVPRAAIVGGCALIMCFAVAAAIHLLHGAVNVLSLLVYAAAAIVVMAHANRK